MNETEMVVRYPTESAVSWQTRFRLTTGNNPKLADIEAAGFSAWSTNDIDHKDKMLEYSHWLLANLPNEDFVITLQRDQRLAFKSINGEYKNGSYCLAVIDSMIIFFTRDTDLVMFKLSAL